MSKRTQTTSRPRKAGSWQPRLILVPTDFSYPAEQALKHALALARRTGARLALLHVIHHPVAPDLLFASSRPDRGLMRELAGDRMRRLCARFRLRSVQGKIVEGNPAEAIVEHAAALNAGLVVIASRGHSMLERMLLGSTAERVVRQAGCPVLLLPLAR